MCVCVCVWVCSYKFLNTYMQTWNHKRIYCYIHENVILIPHHGFWNLPLR